ncbi:MAG: hypothetical protein U1E84_03190 [Rhodoferax sp.]
MALDDRLVQVLHPAFLRVDGGAALGGIEQRIGIQRHGGLEVHALGVAVLLEAGIHRYPGIRVAKTTGQLINQFHSQKKSSSNNSISLW